MVAHLRLELDRFGIFFYGFVLPGLIILYHARDVMVDRSRCNGRWPRESQRIPDLRDESPAMAGVDIHIDAIK